MNQQQRPDWDVKSMNLALARVAWSRVQHEESMALYERVKQSLRDGADPDHVGHIFGVSGNTCRAIKQMLDAQDSTDRLMRGLFESHDKAPQEIEIEPKLHPNATCHKCNDERHPGP